MEFCSFSRRLSRDTVGSIKAAFYRSEKIRNRISFVSDSKRSSTRGGKIFIVKTIRSRGKGETHIPNDNAAVMAVV